MKTTEESNFEEWDNLSEMERSQVVYALVELKWNDPTLVIPEKPTSLDLMIIRFSMNQKE